jgi:hypothetical protein
MDKSDKHEQQGDLRSWIILGLVIGAVTAALYGPFVWELTHRA